jgi:hypothetical protein
MKEVDCIDRSIDAEGQLVTHRMLTMGGPLPSWVIGRWWCD